MPWDNLEQAFKDLDKKEFFFFASALGAYRKALMDEGGFTRREAMRLVETYSKFIYDMSIEEFISEKRLEEFSDEYLEEDDDEDVATDDDDELI